MKDSFDTFFFWHAIILLGLSFFLIFKLDIPNYIMPTLGIFLGTATIFVIIIHKWIKEVQEHIDELKEIKNAE